MPAERTRKPRSHHNAKAGPSKVGGAGADGKGASRHRVPTLEQRDGLMGVSKIKSQLRQTKRLLAKENLEPGLRVATQRRLVSLEADLAAAEKRGVEKKNGARYHKIKFFERQKLQRIIKRVVRELEALGEPAGEGDGETQNKKKGKEDKKTKASDKKRKALVQELDDARVMLNYVIHFPNSQKYISLWVKTSDTGADADADADTDKESLALPPHLDAKEAPAAGTPAARRHEILLEMRRLMGERKLSGTPESEARGQRGRGPTGTEADIEIDGPVRVAEVRGKREESKEEQSEDEDDFFGDD